MLSSPQFPKKYCIHFDTKSRGFQFPLRIWPIHVVCSLYMGWRCECFDFTNFFRQYLSSIVWPIHVVCSLYMDWGAWLEMKQYHCYSPHSFPMGFGHHSWPFKSFIETLMASPFRITMDFFASLVVSKTHWELVRTVTIVYLIDYRTSQCLKIT